MDDAQIALNELNQTNLVLQNRCIQLAIELAKVRKQLDEATVKEEPK